MGLTSSSSSVCANRPAHTGAIVLGSASGAEASDTVERPDDRNKLPSIRHQKSEHDRLDFPLPTPPDSPQSLLRLEGEEVETNETKYVTEGIPENERRRSTEPFLDMKLLGLNLSMNQMQCRALTTRDWPCKRNIPKDEHNEIPTLLHAMNQQGLSFERLVECLESLTSLVHCFQHKIGVAKDSRLDTWISFIARPPGTPKPGLLISRDIIRALDSSTRCVGLTKNGTRCKLTIGGQRVHNCRRTLEQLVDPEVYRNESFVNTYLKVLEVNRYCRTHTKQHRPELKEKWKSAIGVARGESFSKAERSEDLHTDQLGSSLKNQDVDLSYATTRSRNLHTSLSLTVTSTASMDAAAFWPEAMETSPWTILAKKDQVGSMMQSSVVSSVARKPLDTQDQKMGWVYIYQVQGNSKLLKIGYTGRSVVERHREWEFDCNRTVLPVYPLKPGTPVKIENARRVEALCHAELENCRVWVYCQNCMKDHNEWFDVSKDRAVSIVKGWTSWMATKPYRGTRLKSEDEKRLSRERL
jgi:hypothetical protein